MPQKRIIEFDYIRVLSLLGILLCHSCFEFGTNFTWLGRYLGSTFNFLFLILSAFLLGMAWRNNGYKRYSIGFITHKIGRLSKSYYPYLAVLFVFLYLSQDFFSWKKIITHLAYLPWFDKINGFGHLWFMSMILICYAGCFLFSRFNAKPTRRKPLIICTLSIGGGYFNGLYC